MGVCCRAFDNLRDVRGLEYELDFVTNRASRDLQVHLASLCPHDDADLAQQQHHRSNREDSTLQLVASIADTLDESCQISVCSEVHHAEAGWLAVEVMRNASHVIVVEKE